MIAILFSILKNRRTLTVNFEIIKFLLILKLLLTFACMKQFVFYLFFAFYINFRI